MSSYYIYICIYIYVSDKEQFIKKTLTIFDAEGLGIVVVGSLYNLFGQLTSLW